MPEKLYFSTTTGYEVFKKGPKAGQPKTLTDRVIRFLIEQLHREECTQTSKKFRKFQSSNPDSFLWVGKSGAVRVGKNQSNSISITEKYHTLMCEWERANDK